MYELVHNESIYLCVAKALHLLQLHSMYTMQNGSS